MRIKLLERNTKCVHNFNLWKAERKKPLGALNRSSKDSIKTYEKLVVVVYILHLFGPGQVLGNTVMNQKGS
jgi:hypothetical protein